MNKTCSTCKQEFPLTRENFHVNNSTVDGFKSRCKDCENEYKRNHPWERKYTPLSKLPKDQAAAAREHDASYVKRKTAEWIAENGPMPTCECGCGETVRWSRRYRGPARFVDRHYNYTEEKKQRASESLKGYHQKKIEDGDFIEIKKLRTAIKKVKADKGWTWDEVAFHGGLSKGHIRSMMSDDRVISVNRDLVWGFFRRIAGMSAPASTFQKRERVKDLIADAGMDKDNWDGEEEARYRETNRLREQRRRAASKLP